MKKGKKFKDSFISNLIVMTITLFSIELIFRIISSFKIFSVASLRILLSTFLISLLVTFITNITKRKWLKNFLNITFVFIYSLYTLLQIGFINYLGVYISFHSSSQLGAVKDYIKDYLLSFKPVYYIILLPFIIYIIYLIVIRKKEYYKHCFNKSYFLIILMLFLGCFGYYETLTIPRFQNKYQIKSNISLFKNPDVPTIAVNQFGTTIFGLLDFKSYAFPIEEEYNLIQVEKPSKPVIVKREVPHILDELANNDSNNKYSDLNKYFASKKVTDYNEYTGKFEGKNVVVILMESVNDGIINEKYFPNYMKLYNEGWHWKNNYSPRNSCATGNNEFSGMTGLFSIYNTCTINVYKNNKYFESIFGLFNRKGYNTTSMHDFVDWYYYRKIAHPNLGSGHYYGANELKIKTASYGEWPSDVEFFDKAFNIILNNEDGKPWMTWLTMVTSHQPYSNNSTYGNKYKDFFINEGYSVPVSRYLSKLKIVDEAIGLMIQKLNDKGILDDTLIVILDDHYPYGLKNNYIKEMINYDITDYEIERTPLLMYNPSMEPREFTNYNSYINLTPTIANLLNLDYDPRLYAGKDILSPDYESRVVFADGSWKNEIAYYNASKSDIKYYTDKTYTDDEIKAINDEVNLQISMSSKAIKLNYFNYLEKEYEKYKIKQEEELNNSIPPTIN